MDAFQIIVLLIALKATIGALLLAIGGIIIFFAVWVVRDSGYPKVTWFLPVFLLVGLLTAVYHYVLWWFIW